MPLRRGEFSVTGDIQTEGGQGPVLCNGIREGCIPDLPATFFLVVPWLVTASLQPSYDVLPVHVSVSKSLIKRTPVIWLPPGGSDQDLLGQLRS